MTSWQSMLGCAQADVTLERIAALVAETGTEPVTVDFKEKAGPRVAECVAAMANTYGGLIFVGISDTDREIVGVKVETAAHVADMLTTKLSPSDWLPEMFEVALGPEQPGRYVLVIRVRYETAPRPVFVQRTIGSGDDKTTIFYAPVRRPGGTRQATRDELASLFGEQPDAAAELLGWDINAPQIPSGNDAARDQSVDFVLKTGLFIPPGPSAPGRPLSDRVIKQLCAAFDDSPLQYALFGLTGLGRSGVFKFDRQGRPNTSTTATLHWRIAEDPPPFAVVVRIEAPDQYGHSHIQTLQFTVEITSRLSAWMHSDHSPVIPRVPGAAKRLDVREWRGLLDSIIATMTGDPVVNALADLADVDPIVVPLPRTLHIVSQREMASFLPPLAAIPDADGSRGAHLRADPALSLGDPEGRDEQVKRWLCQISADAGLRGMDELVDTLAPFGERQSA